MKKLTIEIYTLPVEVEYYMDGEEICYHSLKFNKSNAIPGFEDFFNTYILKKIDEAVLENEANLKAIASHKNVESYNDQFNVWLENLKNNYAA